MPADDSQANSSAALPVVGWREWVSLPEIGLSRIKAKVDTGARSSSLQAVDLEPFERDGNEWVRFTVHPRQRSVERVVVAEAPVLEYRDIRSSNGETSRRPVIRTTVELSGVTAEIDLTLAGREGMGFRMLLGREAVRSRFLVDPGRSYCGGSLRKKKKRRKSAAEDAQ